MISYYFRIPYHQPALLKEIRTTTDTSRPFHALDIFTVMNASAPRRRRGLMGSVWADDAKVFLSEKFPHFFWLGDGWNRNLSGEKGRDFVKNMKVF